jgi:hypothetical protein
MSRFALAALLLSACTATHDEPPEAPTTEPVPSVAPTAEEPAAEEPAAEEPAAEEPVAAPPPQAAAGRFPIPSEWTSPACETRSYERQLRFEGERFEAKDLVAPCPPGTQCVWSGIIVRAGSFSLDRKQLRLLPDTDAPSAPQAGKFPLPPHLWLAADGTLTEDEGACPYTMMD